MKKQLVAPTLAIVAMLAIVLSVGSISYSAGKIDGATIAKRSIAAKAVKKNALTSAEVQDGSLTGADIKNGTLTSAQIDESTLPFAGKAAEPVHVIGAPGEIPFGTGWGNAGNSAEQVPGFWKDQGGVVHLRGAIGGGSDVMFTLPDGYRPALEEFFLTYGDSFTVAYVNITADGAVHFASGSSSGYVGLGNITFRAGP